jgi:hypothetical protein
VRFNHVYRVSLPQVLFLVGRCVRNELKIYGPIQVLHFRGIDYFYQLFYLLIRQSPVLHVNGH